jgi:hypothetical protein
MDSNGFQHFWGNLVMHYSISFLACFARMSSDTMSFLSSFLFGLLRVRNVNPSGANGNAFEQLRDLVGRRLGRFLN